MYRRLISDPSFLLSSCAALYSRCSVSQQEVLGKDFTEITTDTMGPSRIVESTHNVTDLLKECMEGVERKYDNDFEPEDYLLDVADSTETLLDAVLATTINDTDENYNGEKEEVAHVKKCAEAFVDKFFRKDSASLWEEVKVDKEEWESMSGLVRICNHSAMLRTIGDILGEKPEVGLLSLSLFLFLCAGTAGTSTQSIRALPCCTHTRIARTTWITVTCILDVPETPEDE